MDFQKLFNGLKEEQKSMIQTDNFYVGDGILKCENYFVPLDAISYVSLTKKADLSIWSNVALCIMGLLLLILPFAFFRIIGFIMIGLGMLGVYLIIRKNKKKEYYLNIRLNNNGLLHFVSGEKEFMQDIMGVMQQCINNRKGVYHIMIGEQKIYNVTDNSIGKTSAGRDIYGLQSSVVGRDNTNVVCNGNSNRVNVEHALTEKEWEDLEKFFQKKLDQCTPDNKNHKVYNQILSVTKKRDEDALGDIMKRIGKKAIETIVVAGVGEATKNIILPILLKLI